MSRRYTSSPPAISLIWSWTVVCFVKKNLKASVALSVGRHAELLRTEGNLP